MNDTLHSRPCLLPIILEVLLRFRLGQVGWVTDIRQAFLQIEIDRSNHRKCSIKKRCSEKFHNTQENTCAKDSVMGAFLGIL